MAGSKFQNGTGVDANDGVGVNQMHAPILREHDEPRDGYEPVPVFWLLVALSLAMGCGWYLGSQSGNFAAVALDGDPQLRGEVTTALVKPPVDPVVRGRRIYNNCMACHQQDGRGLEKQFPPLAGSEWVMGEPRVLARILLHGMHDDVIVAGASYNGLMPGWSKLDDASIAGVLSYIRSAWGNDALPVQPEVIAQERRITADRGGPWTMRELQEAFE